MTTKRAFAIVAMALIPLAVGMAGRTRGVAGEKVHTPVVVLLGDSTTRDLGPEAPAVKREVDALIKSVKDRPAVINAGVGGDTAGGGLARLERSVLAHHPDVVTVSFGLNDTGSVRPATFKENLANLVQALHKANVKVVLMTSTPFDNERHVWAPKFKDKGGLDEYLDKELLASVRELADGKDVLLCDLHAIFKEEFRKNPESIATLICPDGVHLTPAGNDVMAKHMAPVIAAAITSLTSSPAP